MTEPKQRQHFENQLQLLGQEVVELGNMVDAAVRKSLTALKFRDLITAATVEAEDQWINEKRFAIEKAGLILIATQQPTAKDLRFLAAVLEIITELERMGDYAKGIARINLRMDPEEPKSLPIEDLEAMADLGLNMLQRTLRAFQGRDSNEARMIPKEDDRVDALFNRVFQDLIEQSQCDSSAVYRINLVLWVAHNLERLADRVTNICERIVFWVDGEMRELDVLDHQTS